MIFLRNKILGYTYQATSGGGGGSAGSSVGAGATGGAGNTSTNVSGGGGGAGAANATTVGSAGASPSTNAGGAGGNGGGGTGGGAGATSSLSAVAGTAGTGGGGGGGYYNGGNPRSQAAAGGSGATIWTAGVTTGTILTVGFGGGGGGGGVSNSAATTGGASYASGNGLYTGSGGGGAGGYPASGIQNGGHGGDGIIVVTYNTLAPRTLYWVGGSGTWDTSTTTHWSLSSGGGGGQNPPNIGDTVIINGSSGSPTITMATSLLCASLNTTGATCTLNFSSGGTFNINASLILSATTTWTTSSAVTLNIKPLATTSSITTNNIAFNNTAINVDNTSNTNACTTTVTGNIVSTNTATGITLTGGTAVGTKLTIDISSGSQIKAPSINIPNKYLGITFGTTGSLYFNGAIGNIASTIDNTNLSYTGTPTATVVCSSSYSQLFSFIGSQTVAGFNYTVSGTVGVGNFIMQGTGSFSNGQSVNNLDISGITAVTGGGTINIFVFVYGNFVGTNASYSAIKYGSLVFSAPSGTQTITSNGFTFGQINLGGGSTVQLIDDLTCDTTWFNSVINVNSGTFNANNKNVTTPSFIMSGGSTTMGSGTWYLHYNNPSHSFSNSSFSISGGTLTINTANIIIELNGASGDYGQFYGGGYTYNTLTFNAISNINYYIGDTNTFSALKSSGFANYAIYFAATATITIGTWGITGSAGNFVTVTGDTPGTPSPLVYSGTKVVSADYLTIAHTTVTPATLTWYAGANSLNSGDNFGWIFTAPPSPGNLNFLQLF